MARKKDTDDAPANLKAKRGKGAPTRSKKQSAEKVPKDAAGAEHTQVIRAHLRSSSKYGEVLIPYRELEAERLRAFEEDLDKLGAKSVPASEGSSSTKWQAAKTRIGKRAITFWLTPEQFKAVKLLAAEENMKIQDMALEAMMNYVRENKRSRL